MRFCVSIIMAVFQMMIMATGNYNFFNILTLILCMGCCINECDNNDFKDKNSPRLASDSARRNTEKDVTSKILAPTPNFLERVQILTVFSFTIIGILYLFSIHFQADSKENDETAIQYWLRKANTWKVWLRVGNKELKGEFQENVDKMVVIVGYSALIQLIYSIVKSLEISIMRFKISTMTSIPNLIFDVLGSMLLTMWRIALTIVVMIIFSNSLSNYQHIMSRGGIELLPELPLNWMAMDYLQPHHTSNFGIAMKAMTQTYSYGLFRTMTGNLKLLKK